MTDVPIFSHHPTSRFLWSIMATFSGDVQNSPGAPLEHGGTPGRRTHPSRKNCIDSKWSVGTWMILAIPGGDVINKMDNHQKRIEWSYVDYIIYIYIYVCIYESIYIGIYVTMYLCTYVPMYQCTCVSMYLCIYVSMYLCIYHGYMDLCVYVTMYLLPMYLCIYVTMYLLPMYLCIFVSMYLCFYVSMYL